MVHELKIEADFYEQIRTGNKLFEVRKDDRHYSVGDILALNEVCVDPSIYTGRSLLVRVTHILRDERFCKENYVIMGIKRLGITENYFQGVEFEIYGGDGK